MDPRYLYALVKLHQSCEGEWDSTMKYGGFYATDMEDAEALKELIEKDEYLKDFLVKMDLFVDHENFAVVLRVLLQDPNIILAHLPSGKPVKIVEA